MDEEFYDDMNEGELSEEETYQEIKEKLLFQLEAWDLIAIVDNFLWAQVHIANWEKFQKSRQELGEALQVGMEFVKYIFNNQQIDEAYRNMTEEKYQENEEKYGIAKIVIELIEKDEDVQNLFIKRLKELEYDENDSKIKKATNIQIIKELLMIHRVVSNFENNSNLSIQSVIAEALECMSTENVIKIYDDLTQRNFIGLPIVNQVVLDRIEEMSDIEFFMFIGSSNTDILLTSQEIKEKIYEKVEKQQSSILSTLYIRFFAKHDDFLAVLLPKIKKVEKVNAVIEAKVNEEHSVRVTKRLINMINNFSEEEFVRYIMFTPNCENEIIANAIQEKMEALTDDDLKFLFWIYDKMQSSPRVEKLEDLLIKRSLLKEVDGILDFIPTPDEEFSYGKKSQEYLYSMQLYKKYCPFPKGYKIGYIDVEESEKTNRNVVIAFQENDEIIKSYKEFWDYIELLSKTNDEDLYKTIIKYNKQFAFKELDPNLFEYYKFVVLYLGERILYINDEQFLSKLYMLSDGECLFFDTAITRMLEKKISMPCLYVEKNEPTDPKVDEKQGTHNGEKNSDKKPSLDKDPGEKE